jgi:type II secretory pathway pseudopilin PulG
MRHRKPRNRQAGFTLIELAISLIVIVEVLLAVLMLFDFTNKLSHAQTNIADMQESLRLAQSEMEGLVRMAGRGGLKFSPTAPGQALWVTDNVTTANERIGDNTSPQIVIGSDVLTVRGVFTAPIYQINFKDTTVIEFRTAANVVTPDPALASTVRLRISGVSPTFINQDLQPLIDAVNNNVSEAFVLVSARNPDVFAVVELIPSQSVVNVVGQVTLVFRIRGNPGDLVSSYALLSPTGAYPNTMTSVSSVGLLEEHRFYVRRSYVIPNNTASDPNSKLTRARFMPGTNIAYGPTGNAGNTANLSLDLADNVLDMQVALGLDTVNHSPRTQPPGSPAEPSGLTTIQADRVNGYISESATGLNDDWLYNNTNDSVANAVWANVPVYYVRLNLLARTDRRDSKYEAPLLGTIEDRVYAANDPLNLANTAAGSKQLRMFRRRILQTVIDVRNNV